MCTWESFAVPWLSAGVWLLSWRLQPHRGELLGACAAWCILLGLETFAWRPLQTQCWNLPGVLPASSLWCFLQLQLLLSKVISAVLWVSVLAFQILVCLLTKNRWAKIRGSEKKTHLPYHRAAWLGIWCEDISLNSLQPGCCGLTEWKHFSFKCFDLIALIF